VSDNVSKKGEDSSSGEEDDGSNEEEEEEENKQALEPGTKVRDHDHRKQKDNFRGAAHSWCNLQFRTGWKKGKPSNQWKIPVVIHNLKGYDSHLIIRSIHHKHHLKQLQVIPQQGEAFLSFQFSNLQFIDSLSFLQGSLDTAVSALNSGWDGKGPEGISKVFPYLVREFAVQRGDGIPAIPVTDRRFELLLRKGIFPYEYMDGPLRFAETRLPPIEAFFSLVRDEHISEEGYQHAHRVWDAFQLKNLGQYQDLYMKLDVFLLHTCIQRF
jgi:hypothetical protein